MTLKCADGMPAAVVAEFDRLAALFERHATEIDAIALEVLAANLAMWRKAVKDTDEVGQVVMSGGIAIANPSIQVAERAQAKIQALISELGISTAFKRKVSR